MFNTVLLIVAAGMAAWNVYRLIKGPDVVAVVTVLFWAVLLWRIVSPLDWHISVLAGLLLLKVILAQRRQSRDRGNVPPSGRPPGIDRPASGRGGSAPSTASDDEELDDIIDSEEEDEALAKIEKLSLKTTPICGALVVRFTVKVPQSFPTTTGQSLKVEAGEHSGTLSLRLAVPPSDDVADNSEEAWMGDLSYVAPLNEAFSFKDAAGKRWHSQNVLCAGVPLNIERIWDSDPQIVAQFWTDAPAELQRVFRERCLVANCEVADDGRVRFAMMVGDRQLIIMTKYLGWEVDLALDPDGRRVWVRVIGLMEEVWKGDPFGEESAAAEWDGFRRVPAFYYALPVEDFLPVTQPGRFVETLKELSPHERADGAEDAIIFRPVVD